MSRVAAGLAALIVAVVVAGGAPGARSTEAADCTRTVNPSNIASTLTNVRPFDVICMSAGVYRGPLVLWSKSAVTLRGEGRATIVAGGNGDGIVVLNGGSIVIEDMLLYMGSPANAFVGNSTNVTFRNVDVGGGGIGIHFDDRSSGSLVDSRVYALRHDAVLIRRGSSATIEGNWIFSNGGVGVSAVGRTGSTTIRRNIISHHGGPGIFAGEPPCALLPPASAVAPACFLSNPDAYVGEARLLIDGNVIQASASTGVVLFPGTTATMRANRIWRNELTGLFVWGASVNSDRDEHVLNEEHAIEVRSYPDPWQPASSQIRSQARFNNNDLLYSLVLPQTGTLGGGVVALGSDVDLLNSRVLLNRGIGVSYLDGARGRVQNNVISHNRGSGLCIFRTTGVTATGNQISYNADDRIGACMATP